MIAFLAMATLALGLDAVVTGVQRWIAGKRAGAPVRRRRRGGCRPPGASPWWSSSSIAGLYEQTPRVLPDYAGTHAQVESDEAFFDAVAATVPGGAVFELPRMAFPEAPPRFGTRSYDQAKGYIFHPELRWSFGYVDGRQPDYVLNLQDGPPEQVARGAVAMGFDGITLDRNGFDDLGAALETAITADAGPPVVTSADTRYLFFDLRPFAARLRADPATAAALDAERANLVATGRP